jgi:hypothetical protein
MSLTAPWELAAVPAAVVRCVLRWTGMWWVVFRRGVWAESSQRGGRQYGTPSVM